MSTKQDPDTLGTQHPPEAQPPNSQSSPKPQSPPKFLSVPKAEPLKLFSPPPPPKAHSPVAPSEVFRSNDLELLRTGRYSDAQVTTASGGRVWKVHKGIVCQRSGYLREASFATSEDGEPMPLELPFDTTEDQAELLFEFIYSGGIKDIKTFTMADCVDLTTLGENFLVGGMVDYATSHLWARLQPMLESLSMAAGSPMQAPSSSSASDAIDKAYGSNNTPSQLFLADFVWAARAQLFGTPAMVVLHRAHPLFATHVFTALNMGPQSSFFSGGRRHLLLDPCRCWECAWLRDGGDRPKHALQTFDPESRILGREVAAPSQERSL